MKLATKPAPADAAIAELLAKRWSARAIDANIPVGGEDLRRLLEAARWAPSCFGEEPWRYLVWDRFKQPEAWQQALSCLAPSNQRWAKNAPVLMLSVAVPTFRRNGKPNRWAQHDVGAASENLCLQAAALGLVAHQMGGFDVDQAHERFHIPRDHTCLAMIAIGHPAPIGVLEDDLQARESAPRTRRPLSDIYFEGGWPTSPQ